MKRPPKETFTVRLPPKVIKALRHAANTQERPASEIIREAVEGYLIEHPPTE